MTTPKLPGRPLTAAEMASGFAEYKRVFKMARMTQKLIEVSRVPEANRTDAWAEERAELQHKLESLAAAPLNHEAALLGAWLRTLAESAEGFCPLCESPLIRRTGKHGEFLGCSTYPRCKHSEKVDA